MKNANSDVLHYKHKKKVCRAKETDCNTCPSSPSIDSWIKKKKIVHPVCSSVLFPFFLNRVPFFFFFYFAFQSPLFFSLCVPKYSPIIGWLLQRFKPELENKKTGNSNTLGKALKVKDISAGESVTVKAAFSLKWNEMFLLCNVLNVFKTCAYEAGRTYGCVLRIRPFLSENSIRREFCLFRGGGGPFLSDHF